MGTQKVGATTQSRSSNPTKGATERTLAAAPFGAEPGRFCSFKGRVAQVGRFEEAIPMLTHGSDCQRAGLARSVLVVFSGVQGEDAASAPAPKTTT